MAIPAANSVNQLCFNVLDRPADSGGLAFHLDNLANGFSRGDVAVGFTESPEYQLNTIGQIDHGIAEVLSEFAQRAKAAWARLIGKVYEAGPLECSKCKGLMRVIALIEDSAVVRAILTHLGRWQPKAVERARP